MVSGISCGTSFAGELAPWPAGCRAGVRCLALAGTRSTRKNLPESVRAGGREFSLRRLGALLHKYLHCFVFICGRQASGRWIDVAIPRLRINWEFLLRLSEMWYFRPQQSLRRTDNTSVLSSGTHEKAALSGRLADRLRWPVASWPSWAGRRSQGTLGVQLYTAWPRQVISGQQRGRTFVGPLRWGHLFKT